MKLPHRIHVHVHESFIVGSGKEKTYSHISFIEESKAFNKIHVHLHA